MHSWVVCYARPHAQLGGLLPPGPGPVHSWVAAHKPPPTCTAVHPARDRAPEGHLHPLCRLPRALQRGRGGC